MFKTKSLLAAASIASLIAAPALALEVSADATLGAAPEDMTTVKMVEGSAFVGNEVRTKDQIVIGQVDGVYEGTAGEQVVMITLNSDVAAKSSVKSFTVPLASDMTADGSLTLGWTESELFTSLSGNLDAASTENDTGNTAGTDGAADGATGTTTGD
ncbi:hypothetical protein [Tabrizicola sp. BL-A-41-H6]|uniref:hypothetical protein n=1 Tax=Tabrizicola sp. BL-A-41-H6 TaxID=3421107 RepID=UPI003D6671A2